MSNFSHETYDHYELGDQGKFFQLTSFYREDCRNMLGKPTCSWSELWFACSLVSNRFVSGKAQVVLPGYGLMNDLGLITKGIELPTSMVVKGTDPDNNLTIAVDSSEYPKSIKERYEGVEVENYPEVQFWGMRRVRPVVEYPAAVQAACAKRVGSLEPFKGYVIDLGNRQFLRVAEMMMDILGIDEGDKSRTIDSLLNTWSGDYCEAAWLGRMWYWDQENLGRSIAIWADQDD